jgi:hypothetical protein
LTAPIQRHILHCCIENHVTRPEQVQVPKEIETISRTLRLNSSEPPFITA